jgi:hypothetical protein
MSADMVFYGSSKHAEHEVEKIEVPSDANTTFKVKCANGQIGNQDHNAIPCAKYLTAPWYKITVRNWKFSGRPSEE